MPQGRNLMTPQIGWNHGRVHLRNHTNNIEVYCGKWFNSSFSHLPSNIGIELITIYMYPGIFPNFEKA